MSKSFQRIRSMVEARQIYARLPSEGQEIFCKGEGALFAFRPERFDPKEGLEGLVVGLDDGLIENESVVVNFLLGTDRYYTVSEFQVTADRGLLKLSENLYKLERRSSFRLSIPKAWSNKCNIIQHNGKASFIPVEILDISQGGAKIVLPIETLPTLASQQLVRGVFHIRNKWKLEIDGVVQHLIRKEGQFLVGLRFQVEDERLKRRLLAMMLEMQRENWRTQNGW